MLSEPWFTNSYGRYFKNDAATVAKLVRLSIKRSFYGQAVNA